LGNKSLFFWSLGLYCILIAINLSRRVSLLLLIFVIITFFCLKNRLLHISLIIALPFAGVLQRHEDYNTLSISFVLQGILILIFYLEVTMHKIQLIDRHWIFLQGAFLAIMIFSTLRNPYSTLAWLATLQQIGWLLGTFAIFYYVESPKQISIILKFIILVCFCSYLIALLQAFSGGDTVINLTREGYEYIKWNMINRKGMYGPALDSTIFGKFMRVGWCISLFRIEREKGYWRVILLILLLSFTHGIYLSHSREAVLGCCLAMFLYCITKFWMTHNKAWLLVGVGMIVSSFFVLKWAFLTFKNLETFSEVLVKDVRMQMLPIYLNAFATNPLIGIGKNIFVNEITSFGFREIEGLVNSTPLMLLVEQGILGLSIFCLLFANLWHSLFYLLHTQVNKELKNLTSLFLALSVIFFICGFFSSNMNSTFFWLIFFLGYRLIEFKNDYCET
jgi:hypothetical protein